MGECSQSLWSTVTDAFSTRATDPRSACAADIFNSVHYFEHPLIEWAAEHRLNRVAKLPGVRGRGMRFEGFFTSPGLGDREMVRAHGALQNVEPQIAFVFATILRKAPEQTWSIELGTGYIHVR